MPTPFAQLLEQLKAAQGDTAALALVTFDFAVASDPMLKEAAISAAIPHWFDEKTLPSLLPEHAGLASALFEQVKALPMVECYNRGTGQPAWNIHESTRLALRARLWKSDPERFKLLSRRAASAYGSADPNAPDYALTCEHLYHQLAGQTDEGDAEMAQVAGDWRMGFRYENLQFLARLSDELLGSAPSALSLRGKGLCHLTIADARKNHQPAPTTEAGLQQAEECFRRHAANEPADTATLRNLSITLNKLGDLAVAQGDLAGALRCFTEGKIIAERLANSDPENAAPQRDLSVSVGRLGDLAVAQGDLAGALHYFTQGKIITERLAAGDPTNAAWQRDVSVALYRLGGLAAALGDPDTALLRYSESKTMFERLAARDPSNAAWQRDLAVSFNKLGDLAMEQRDLPSALRCFTQCKTIFEQLAASDPTNSEWQRSFAGSIDKLGDLAVAEGDLAAALQCFTQSKSIIERLAASDPSNAGWQHDLFHISYVIATKVLWPQQRWAEALALMEQNLQLCERLAASDPLDTLWRDGVQMSRERVAVLRTRVAANQRQAGPRFGGSA